MWRRLPVCDREEPRLEIWATLWFGSRVPSGQPPRQHAPASSLLGGNSPASWGWPAGAFAQAAPGDLDFTFGGSGKVATGFGSGCAARREDRCGRMGSQSLVPKVRELVSEDRPIQRGAEYRRLGFHQHDFVGIGPGAALLGRAFLRDELVAHGGGQRSSARAAQHRHRSSRAAEREGLLSRGGKVGATEAGSCGRWAGGQAAPWKCRARQRLPPANGLRQVAATAQPKAPSTESCRSDGLNSSPRRGAWRSLARSLCFS